jgi:hypothetical protein
MAFGALGSLASRVEDAQNVAAPASLVLVVGYFASFAMIAQPESPAARAISLFPLTAPLAMPGRIALGATAWWEPALAVVLTVGAIALLVYFGGRVYVRAILRAGTTLTLREAWRGTAAGGGAAVPAAAGAAPAQRGETAAGVHHGPLPPRVLAGVIVVGVSTGVVVAMLSRDVVIGVIVAAGFIAAVVELARLFGRSASGGRPAGPSRG